MIGIPSLHSDAFLILDCFTEGLAESDHMEKVKFMLDDDYSWAQYAMVFAGYTQKSTPPGKLSEKLMSILEDLVRSNKFYARAGLITSGTVRTKLTRELRWGNDLEPVWSGNDGKDFIHLTPL